MAVFAGSIAAGVALIIAFGGLGALVFAILLAALAGWAISLAKDRAPRIELARDLQRAGRWSQAEAVWEQFLEKAPIAGEHVIFNWLICTFHSEKWAWVGPRFCKYVGKLSERHFMEATLLVMLAEVNLNRLENAHICARCIAAIPREHAELPLIAVYAVDDTVLAGRDLTTIIAALSKIRDNADGTDEESANIARLTDAYLDAHSAFKKGLPQLPGNLSDYGL